MSNIFEFTFTNFNRKTKTKKKSKIKTSYKKLDKTLFNSNLYNFYSKYNYNNISEIYNKISNHTEENKWNWFLLYNINYYFIYRLSDIVLQGDIGISEFINQLTKVIKNDSKHTSYKEKYNDLIKFQKENINKNTIIFDKYELLPLTNNNYLSPFVIKIIDILNRYFNHISSEFDIINFGFYIPKTDLEINNIVKTINQYRIDKMNTNYEIKYQQEAEKTPSINKLNFIITYGSDNKKLLDYIDEKLYEGGNLIFFANMDTPIKSSIVKELLTRFKKSIITKATLDDPFNWIFVGKGFTSNKITDDNDRMMNFINNSFKQSCINFNTFLNNVEKISKLSNQMLVKEINKKYIEIYKWCLNNNIDAINLFADSDKEPQLVDANKMADIFFPNQKGINKKDIKMFDISVYSVTMPQEANLISSTIQKLLSVKYNKGNNIVITDGTANVGGNTLSFSSYFTKVNSIEYNQKTFEGLKYNCQNIYKRKNITFYQGDCTKIIPRLEQDAIFIDPPWNGLFYKAYEKLHLKLGSRDVFDIISEWFNNKKAKIYCIKCPFNFDFEPFIKTFSNIYIQKLKNWNVIYILDY